ncbi:MAG: phage holin family protein [Pseudonocardiales bacterium]|nr:phage holin family protein [Pseudonocardiales bacterium]
MAIAIRIVVIGVAVWVATLIVGGINVGGSTTAANIGTLVVVALIFGVINAVLKPLIKVIGCAFYILTLGLVGLVVNALLFMLVGAISSGLGLPFEVDGFWSAFWGAIVVSVVSFVLHLAIPDRLDER